jgi:hypothetical protein
MVLWGSEYDVSHLFSAYLYLSKPHCVKPAFMGVQQQEGKATVRGIPRNFVDVNHSMAKATMTREAALNEVLRDFQVAEKRYTKAVSDVVQAEIRRDEAKRKKDECYLRLEKARVEFSNEATILGLMRPQNEKMFESKSSNSTKRKGLAGKNEDIRSSPFGSKTEVNDGQEVKKNDKLGKKPSFVSSSSPPQSQVWQKKTNGCKRETETKKENRQPQKRIINKAMTIVPLTRTPQPVLDLCKGRTREWCEKHLDCDSLGLVRQFFMAAFGTRTCPATQKMNVSTIVVSDEWNYLVETTGDVQVLWIGKSLFTDARSAIIRDGSFSLVPSLRDKVAEALGTPQKESIALFFSPVKKHGHIYYVGHWKVKHGGILNPSKTAINGYRCIQMEFVGVNPAIIEAMNRKCT